jgi:hypothetical protein
MEESSGCEVVYLIASSEAPSGSEKVGVNDRPMQYRYQWTANFMSGAPEPQRRADDAQLVSLRFATMNLVFA